MYVEKLNSGLSRHKLCTNTGCRGIIPNPPTDKNASSKEHYREKCTKDKEGETADETKVLAVLFVVAHAEKADENKNHHPNHRNTAMSFNDHWIGMPKSPYLHYTATVSTSASSVPSATSPPIVTKRTTKSKPKRKRKPTKNSKRRHDTDEPTDSDEENYRKKEAYPDFEYDYDSYGPSYGKPAASTPYIMRNSASNSRVAYVNPSASASSPSMRAIFAGVPKIATYVVPSSKKYYVQKVKSHAMYAPPVLSSSSNTPVYAASSNSGVRRIDPLDYDDNAGSVLGPQNSFPPKAVMNKIAEPGQRQPCHGPECHQHHKGLVRFYWRRVVYPPGEGGRGRPSRFRRPTRFRNRRRFRDRARSPSDQKDVYASEPEEDDEEEAEDTNHHDEEEDYDEEENESSTNRRNRWRPGKAYGHDLNEGSNYNDDDKRTYRDKRFAYKRRMKND
ncbi:hypothetical protein AVEN_239298-1 [Araneus ventricosus]|uniref:Uncharacterized protein n=1 Tax=Araneus ventricosus TaxID=182803 RepID=A0A4Y2NM68_ARAVE|nr:hypothetical protein AVEN_239298-1 [Araneus ventricosus]